MRKTTNLMGKIIIVLLLTLMVFSPNLLTAKAASYSYDFGKMSFLQLKDWHIVIHIIVIVLEI